MSEDAALARLLRPSAIAKVDTAVNRRNTLLAEEKDQHRLIRTVMVAPYIAMVVSMIVLALYCHRVLHAASTGADSFDNAVPMVLAVCGFLLASGLAVILQAYHLAQRVAGPAQRLQQAMTRIRNGDIAFRVHLRRGDLLREVAGDFNDLLDWLNRTLPGDMKRGNDVVDVDHEDEDGMDHLTVSHERVEE